jgi:hypothetical protein
MEEENRAMNEKIRALDYNLKDEKMNRNDDSQYTRSSFMVELSGLPPYKQGENTLDIVKRVASLAEIENFDAGQIDVTHRLSQKHNSPVIIMFSQKSYRQNFYFQRNKIKYLHVNQILDKTADYPDPAKRRDANTFIYLNESLTPVNRDIFIKTKQQLKYKQYKKVHPYTVKGQVRVRLQENAEPIILRCTEDIQKI